MQYDFTSIIPRSRKDALALDALGFPGFPGAPQKNFDPIPMWVADMNFPTCPQIAEAVSRRLQHPLFGYFMPPDAYYDAIINWQALRHRSPGLTKEAIGYENGVLGGIVSALKAICRPGEPILLHSPTYIGFTHALEDNGWPIVLSPLTQDGDGVWRMDWEDMAEKVERHRIRVMIFCSPHNPCGRVWTEEELGQLAGFCAAHRLTLISDEIWADIVRPGLRHIPTRDILGSRVPTVTLSAPTKTFNLAGLVGSYHIIPDPQLREQVLRQGDATHYNGPNVLSVHALIGAYSPEGMDWTDQLNRVLADNADFAVDFIRERLPGLSVTKPQGTYMLFVDCSGWCAANGKTIDQVLRACWDVGVIVQDGRPFHGPCHTRMNLALPRARVEEAFDRMEKYVFR